MLLVGLGNPGKNYQKTRHNIGFLTLDALAENYNISWTLKNKFQAEVAEGQILNKKIFLLKPQTYMNLSGVAVKSIASYYNIPSEDIIVIHDDIDLKVGIIKIKLGGSAGGHNGLKSIDSYLTNNYYRIRIGVGRPLEEDVANYVLQNIPIKELDLLKININNVCLHFPLLLEKKLEEFKNKIQV